MANKVDIPLRLVLEDQEWLSDVRLQTIFDALTASGATVRVAGGAVRNALLGFPVTDVDLATTSPPDEILHLAEKAGLRTIPTGVKHGTVTVLSVSKMPLHVEVTTLRRDVRTFGRHAEVAFTDDWLADAARRDFTMNALYCDRNGEIFDPLGGYRDLIAKRIRFVGDARARIGEDYLRILRFFRFVAQYGEGPLDPQGLAACRELREGLDGLSRERIRQEWWKLVAADRAEFVVEAMAEAGILAQVLKSDTDLNAFKRHIKIESFLQLGPDSLMRSINVCPRGGADVKLLRERLRLTNEETTRLERLTAAGLVTPKLRPAERRAILYRLTPPAFRDAVLASWAKGVDSTEDPDWAALYRLVDDWRAPALPLGGRDLLAQGIPPGKEIGALLASLEDWWIATDFRATREELLAKMPAMRQFQG